MSLAARSRIRNFQIFCLRTSSLSRSPVERFFSLRPPHTDEASIGVLFNCFGRVAVCYMLLRVVDGTLPKGRVREREPVLSCRMCDWALSVSHPVGIDARRASRGATKRRRNTPRRSLKQRNFVCLNRFRGREPSRADRSGDHSSVRPSKASGSCPSCCAPSRSRATPNPPPSRCKPFPSCCRGATCWAPRRPAPARPRASRCRCCSAWRPSRRKSFSPALHPVRCLILTPTRELAIQVHESVKTYGKHIPLRSFVVYGGVNINPQIEELQARRRDPGRHARAPARPRGPEGRGPAAGADPRARRGRPHARHGLHPGHQAHHRPAAGGAADAALLGHVLRRDPQARRAVPEGSGDGRGRAPQRRRPSSSRSTRTSSTPNRKRELLAHLVKTNNWEQVLVFRKTKHGANRLASQLRADGINADAIHGNKSQNARIRALEDFKDGKVQRAGRHRHRRARPRHRGAAARRELRPAARARGLRAPHRPHRPRRRRRARRCRWSAREDRPLLAAIEKLIKRKIEVRAVEGFEAGRAPHAAASRARRRARQGAGAGARAAKAASSGQPRRAPRSASRSRATGARATPRKARAIRRHGLQQALRAVAAAATSHARPGAVAARQSATARPGAVPQARQPDPAERGRE